MVVDQQAYVVAECMINVRFESYIYIQFAFEFQYETIIQILVWLSKWY